MNKQTEKDNLAILEKLSTGQSNWLEKAKWRKRNRWWRRPLQKIQIKYYIYKRKIVTFFSL